MEALDERTQSRQGLIEEEQAHVDSKIAEASPPGVFARDEMAEAQAQLECEVEEMQ